MSDLIPPSRNEAITDNNKATLRLTTFLESIAAKINEIENESSEVQSIDQGGDVVTLRDVQYTPSRLYNKNELSSQNGWVGIAATDTSSYISPRFNGYTSRVLESQRLNEDVASGMVDTGTLYKLNTYINVDTIHVYAAEAGEHIKHDLHLQNITDQNNTVKKIIGVDLQVGWNTVTISEIALLKDNEYLVFLRTRDLSVTETFNGQWEYVSDRVGWGQWSNDDTLELNIDDLNENKLTELSTIVMGTVIDVTFEDRFIKYEVTGDPIFGSETVFMEVMILDNSALGFEERVACDFTFVVPTDTEVKYVRDNGFWSVERVSWASTHGYHGVNGEVMVDNNTALGIEMEGTILEASGDWQLIPLLVDSF